jgi:hypothetical protein
VFARFDFFYAYRFARPVSRKGAKKTQRRKESSLCVFFAPLRETGLAYHHPHYISSII